MREIKFRGKRVDSGEWVYGYFYSYIRDDNGKPEYCILQDISNLVSDFKINYVNPNTVGQYTGLKDNNGKEIYEGDMTKDVDTGKTFEIMYHRHMFLRYERKPMYMFYTLDGDCLEVIGNIHDVPTGKPNED